MARNTASAARDAATSDEPNPALGLALVFAAAALDAYLREREQPTKAKHEAVQPHP